MTSGQTSTTAVIQIQYPKIAGDSGHGNPDKLGRWPNLFCDTIGEYRWLININDLLETTHLLIETVKPGHVVYTKGKNFQVGHVVIYFLHTGRL